MEFQVKLTDYLGRLKEVIKYYQSRKIQVTMVAKSKEIPSEFEVNRCSIN